MKSILVTGAAGFIGSHLCDALLKSGYAVVGVDNFDHFYSEAVKRENIANALSSPRFTLLEGDIRDESLYTKLERYPFAAVIHLAGRAGVRPSVEEPLQYVDSNIAGTVRLLEFVREFGSSFIMGSSSSVYGNSCVAPFVEGDCGDEALSPYAATQRSCEVFCHTYHHLYGIDTAVLRFFTVYGPRQRPDLAIHKFTKLIDEGQSIPVFGDGSTRRDYTYVDDIVGGILKILDWVQQPSDEAKYEIFNLGESHTTTLADLIVSIEQALGKKAIIDRKPMQPGDVQQTYADISKAREMVGYNPQTLIAEGIPKFVEWYLQSKRAR